MGLLQIMKNKDKSSSLILFRILGLALLLFSVFNTTLYAEGTKTWTISATDHSFLKVNAGGAYSFAGYGVPANKRLYIHIEDPENEVVYIGLSKFADENTIVDINTAYQFRIKSPSGSIVHGPHSALSPANLTSHAMAVAGPADIVGASGYPTTNPIWKFDPSGQGLSSGDYYIEFNSAGSIRWFDITVATSGASPTAIDGRIWSQAWAVRANNGFGDGQYFDEPFNGLLVAYDGQYGTRIDFNGSGIRPLEGQFSFNDTGPGSSGNKETDRKSVSGASTNPQQKIFLNKPDSAIYPLLPEGSLQNLPLVVKDPANPDITFEVTMPGRVEISLDLGGGNKDIRLFADAVTGVNTVPWDGNNGEGTAIMPDEYPITSTIAYTQGETHFTAYDVEGLDNGFQVFTQTSTGSIGPRLQFWDDSNISTSPGTTDVQVNVDTGNVTRRRWTNKPYGDLNTINTWWYAYRDFQSTIILLPGDYGDAPASYGSAVHKAPEVSTVYLGSIAPDSEDVATTTGDGTGDDTDNIDDEDAFPSGLLDINVADSSYSVDVPCVGTATVAGWIDFNHSGTFEVGEKASNSCDAGIAQLTWTSLNGLSTGATYARFRTATNAASITDAVGGASDGEVEDYPIELIRVYACPDLRADLWFANDESGSVDAQEFKDSLDFLYQISDGFVFDDTDGVKAGITGWGSAVSSAEVLMPITENFGDLGDTGLISTTVVTNGNGTGLRELYDGKKNTAFGTRLDYSSNYLAGLINSNNKGRRDGVKQISAFLTDASNSQLKNANEGGGSSWINAANTLKNAGPDGTAIVLIIIAEAAAAYQTDPVIKDIIDQVVGGGLLVIVDNYAEAADPTKGYITEVINAICNVPDPKKLDWGDAPDTYGTDDTANNSSNGTDKEGASHEIVDDLYLGTVAPDKEGNGQPSADADLDGAEDDAISVFPELSTSTSTYTIPAASINVTNTLGSNATLYGFIDFNKDGDFDDTGESTVATVSTAATNPDTALVFQNFDMSTTAGDTYARFRLSTDIGLIATSAAVDGEVEDYKLAIVPSYDFGDAPDSYGIAQHVVIAAPTIYLGTESPDEEDNSLNADNGATNGTGDDNDSASDEDALASFDKLTDIDPSYAQRITVNNSSTSNANLIGWIDFDGNGVFDDDEASAVMVVSAGSGSSNVLVNWNNIPVDIKAGDSYARFRISSDALTISEEAGIKTDGEVEDHLITIEVGGFTVSGHVYNDKDVNGTKDANDTGIKKVTVVLSGTDIDSNAVCRSTQTGGDGLYRFRIVLPGSYTVYEADGEKYNTPDGCPPTAKDPAGYLSTTANQIGNISVVDQHIENLDFGDVATPSFNANQSQTTPPNTTVSYPHTFYAKTGGSVDFQVNSDVINPATSTGWKMTLYYDADCDQTISLVEGLWSSRINVVADDRVCLIAKVYAPNTANAAESQQIVIESDFIYGDGSIVTTSNVQTVTDLTQLSEAGAGKLSLQKSVQNITTSSNFIDASEQKNNRAQPGDTLRYVIRYSNIDTGALDELIINDSIPAFTSLDNATVLCGLSLPSALTSCTPNINGDELNWTFGGKLSSGGEGLVSYEVTIQ